MVVGSRWQGEVGSELQRMSSAMLGQVERVEGAATAALRRAAMVYGDSRGIGLQACGRSLMRDEGCAGGCAGCMMVGSWRACLVCRPLVAAGGAKVRRRKQKAARSAEELAEMAFRSAEGVVRAKVRRWVSLQREVRSRVGAPLPRQLQARRDVKEVGYVRAKRAAFERRQWERLDKKFPGRRALQAEADAIANRQDDLRQWEAYCAERNGRRRGSWCARRGRCDGGAFEEDSTDGGQDGGGFGQTDNSTVESGLESSQTARGDDGNPAASGGRDRRNSSGDDGGDASASGARESYAEPGHAARAGDDVNGSSDGVRQGASSDAGGKGGSGGKREWWRRLVSGGQKVLGSFSVAGGAEVVWSVWAVRRRREVRESELPRVVAGGRARAGGLWRPQEARARRSSGGEGGLVWQRLGSFAVEAKRRLHGCWEASASLWGRSESTHFPRGGFASS